MLKKKEPPGQYAVYLCVTYALCTYIYISRCFPPFQDIRNPQEVGEAGEGRRQAEPGGSCSPRLRGNSGSPGNDDASRCCSDEGHERFRERAALRR